MRQLVEEGEDLSCRRLAVVDVDDREATVIKAEAGKLSPAIEFQKKDSFTEMEDDYIYFVEYVDRDRILRVRNYQVIEYWMDEDKVKESPEGKYYNLIEITRFLDEEAMP